MTTGTLLLNKAHYPVTTLGPGVRAGIWVQGCTIACRGCIAVDTWPADPDRAVPVEAVLDWARRLARSGPVDGVTISGGEPFQQPEALTSLLDGLAAWRTERSRTGADAGGGRRVVPDFLVYSGYPIATLRRDHAALLARCDAVVAGPYVERRNTGTGLRWRGSTNQRIVALTPLGEQRYANANANQAGDQRREAPVLQVAVEADRAWLIGIPRRGDLERLDARLRAAGIESRAASWRP